MKIGILTFHLPTNFGANLQAYSSSSFFESLGHDVKIINYAREQDLTNARHTSEVQFQAHRSFVESNLCLTKLVTTTKDLQSLIAEEQFELIIIGADAVWRMPKDGSVYFAEWLFEDKKVSEIPVVAMSPAHMGNGFLSLSCKERDVLANCLSKFKYISVRDEWTRRVINRDIFRGDNVVKTINPDPVFLLDNYVNCKWNSNGYLPKEFYLFTFSKNWASGISGAFRRIWFERLKSIIHHRGYKVVELPLPEGTSGLSFDYTVHYPIDPFQWFLWIKNARGFCGLRFHSIVSSIAAGTPFFSIDSYGASTIRNKLFGLLGFYRYASKDDVKSKIRNLLNGTGFEANRVNGYIEGIRPRKVLKLIDGIKIDEIVSLRDTYIKHFKDNMYRMFAKVRSEDREIESLDNECTGCSACLNCCPVDAIKMVEDVEGFYYPKVDYERCVGCGQCDKKCPQLYNQKKQMMRKAYWGYSKSDETRKMSSSGGLFSELSKIIMNNKGVVYGAAFSYEAEPRLECKSTDEIPLIELQKSKYVQSNVGFVYRKILLELEKGRQVLFCGTPCQVDGLQSFLGKRYDNLLLVDFVCHGVPPVSLLRDHLELHRLKNVNDIDFRPKVRAWVDDIVITYSKRRRYQRHWKDDEYYKLFEKYVSLRRSCYSCKYYAGERVSDITMADFWGYNNYNPAIFDSKGLSLFMANTPKGEYMIEELNKYGTFCVNRLDTQYAEYAFVRKMSVPDWRNTFNRRNQFYDDVCFWGYKSALIHHGFKVTVMTVAKSKMKQFVKDVLCK